MAASSPGTFSSLSSAIPCALLSCASRGATPGKAVQNRSMRASGWIPGVSSGGSQTSNHTASKPPAVVRVKGWINDQKRRVRVRTARYTATDDARHRHARIEQLGLLLGLDFNTRKLAHLAHFTANLLYAKVHNWVRARNICDHTSVSKCAS
jgi:hypothetical protein